MAYLDNDGLLYFWQSIKTKFAAASHTHPAMTGASASAAGKAGFVPAPAKGQQGVYLRGDGTWASPAGTTYEPATSSANGLMSSTDKAKLDGFDSASTYAKKGTTLGGYGITDAYTKAQTDSAISNAVSGLYRYKGSVASADKLPASPATGDVYNIETASMYGAAGANVAWNGSAWDSLGEVFSITAITNAEIDGILTK